MGGGGRATSEGQKSWKTFPDFLIFSRDIMVNIVSKLIEKLF